MMKSTVQLLFFLAALILNLYPNQLAASSSVATAFQLRIFETLATSTAPNNNSHTTTLMTSSPLLQTKGGAAHNNVGKQRQQQLAAMSSSSTPSETTNGQHSNHPASKALQSIRTCYKTCLFSTAVDFIITLIDGGDQPGKKLWSKLFLVGNNNNKMKMNNLHLRWTDYVDIFDSLSLLVFALGLHRVSNFYEEWLNDTAATATDVTTQQRISNDNLSKFFSIMNWIWRIVAVNFALGSLSIASALPTIGSSGPFDFIFRLSSNIVSPSSLVMVVVTTLVIGYSIINSFCDWVATIEDENDDKRISSSQRQSKSQLQFKSIREQGYGAYCSQALCAGSFGIYSCMELSKWVIAADSGIVGRGAFLRAAIVRSRDESKTVVGMDEDEAIYNNLFTSQANFYTKVAEVVKGVAIFRLLPYLAAPFVPYATVAFKQIAPALFERVFGA